jgi:hypothetical protein
MLPIPNKAGGHYPVAPEHAGVGAGSGCKLAQLATDMNIRVGEERQKKVDPRAFVFLLA